MYKVEIDISNWGGDEKVTIETTDFEKVQIIQEFIEFQQDNGWAADYEMVAEFDDEDDIEEEVTEESDDEEFDESTVTTYVVTKIED
jgi:hypothetical protein